MTFSALCKDTGYWSLARRVINPKGDRA